MKKLNRWLIVIIFVDLFLIIQTILYPLTQDFTHQWRLVAPFTLSIENNIAAWWSCITLLIASVLSFEKFFTPTHKNNFAWLILSALFAGLSLDELGSMHERLGGWRELFSAVLIFGSLATYSLIKLYTSENSKNCAKYIFIAFMLFGSVVLQEYLEHIIEWESWTLGIRSGIEEGTELAGIFFILYALTQKDTSSLQINSFWPQDNTLKKLKPVLATVLVIHIIGCIIMQNYNDPIAKIGDPRYYGNPMNWYPTITFLTASIIMLGKLIKSTTSSMILPAIIIAGCLLSSMDVATNLFLIIIPNVSSIINIDFANKFFLIIYLIQFLIISLLAMDNIKPFRNYLALGILIVSIIIITTLFNQSEWLRYALLGIISYFMFQSILIYSHNSKSNL